jgi:hypothetical protein
VSQTYLGNRYLAAGKPEYQGKTHGKSRVVCFSASRYMLTNEEMHCLFQFTSDFQAHYHVHTNYDDSILPTSHARHPQPSAHNKKTNTALHQNGPKPRQRYPHKTANCALARRSFRIFRSFLAVSRPRNRNTCAPNDGDDDGDIEEARFNTYPCHPLFHHRKPATPKCKLPRWSSWEHALPNHKNVCSESGTVRIHRLCIGPCTSAL